MMNISKLIVIAAIATSCATFRTYPSRVDWDLDDNNRIDRYEFVTGYSKSHYFKWWCKGRHMSKEEFHTQVYNKLDKNHDGTLSSDEFRSRLAYYFGGGFDADFSGWDDNNDNIVSGQEFTVNAKRHGLFERWDTSNDDYITADEMARGMFTVSDLNGDKSVNSLEFNIWDVNR